MPSGGGDNASAPQHPRPADDAAIDCLLDAQRDIVDCPDIARGGDPGSDQLLGQRHAADRRARRAVRIFAEIVAALLGEVDVQVDQAGHDEKPGRIDDPRGPHRHRDRSGRAGSDDPVALRHHHRVGDWRTATAVDQRAAGHHDDRLVAAIHRRDRQAPRVIGGLGDRSRRGKAGRGHHRHRQHQAERDAPRPAHEPHRTTTGNSGHDNLRGKCENTHELKRDWLDDTSWICFLASLRPSGRCWGQREPRWNWHDHSQVWKRR